MLFSSTDIPPDHLGARGDRVDAAVGRVFLEALQPEPQQRTLVRFK